MKHPIRQLLCLLLCLMPLLSWAQSDVFSKGKASEMQKRIEQAAQRSDSTYKAELALAKKRGIKLIDTLAADKILHFNGFTSTGEPLYLQTYSSTLAGKMTRTNALYSGGGLGLNLTGKSDTMSGKLGIWDGGSLYTAHQEFGGRAKNEEIVGTSSHATHVAGIMVAEGKKASARGMAYQADLKAWDFNNDNTEIIQNSGSNTQIKLLISNHSYGYTAGWNFNTSKNKWQWYGDDAFSDQEDYKFGLYNIQSQKWDEIAYNSPYLLMVKSAGNSRGEAGPAPGENYLLRNGTDTSSRKRQAYTGYDLLSLNSNAKNVLVVGAVDLQNELPAKKRNVSMSSYSSWGPTDDGRIKPDLVGVGTDIESLGISSPSSYANLTGTSMSSPQVAGSLFLLQQQHHRSYGRFMRSATVRGLAIHTAMDILEEGPDYRSGFGLLDAEKAASVIINKDQAHRILEDSLVQGESKKISLRASGKGDLVVTMAWTDPEALLVKEAHDDTTRRLVNDLDIVLVGRGKSHLPFILDPAKPQSLATTGNNRRDNVEKILVVGALPGESYELTYRHKGDLKNGKQLLSLLMSGIGGPSYCAPVVQNARNYLRSLQLNGINKDSSSTDPKISVEYGQNASATLQFSNAQNKSLKIWVDWNQDGDFVDAGELISEASNLNSTSHRFSFKAPSTVKEGFLYRLRISINADNGALDPCGNLANGELEEYALQIIEPSQDASLVSFSQLGNEFCPSQGSTTFFAKVKNQGSAAINGLKVRLNILENGNVISSNTSNAQNLAIDETYEIPIKLEGNLLSGRTYTYQTEILLDTDQNPSNNSLSESKRLSTAAAPNTTGLACAGANTVRLSAAGNQVPLWYSNGKLLGAGNQLQAEKSASFTSSFGTLNTSYGPKSKNDFGGGSYFENFGPAPVISVSTPLVMESARLYVGTAGTIYFDLYDYNTGDLVSSTQRRLSATRTQSNTTRVSNQLIDDKNDPGVVVDLNINFPYAGKFVLFQTCVDGASIYRSNRTKADTINAPSNIGFPFKIDNVIEMEGAFFNNSIITSGYYYFYDMKLRSLGCASESSNVVITEAPKPSASISRKGLTAICSGDPQIQLTATVSSGASLRWLKNGTVLNGSTSVNLSTDGAGKYFAQAINEAGCTANSDTFELKINLPIAPIISNVNGQLQVSGASSPQWFLDGALLTGANANAILPLKSGFYSVKGKDVNGCNATSLNYRVDILSVEEPQYDQFQIYPNPAKDKIQVIIPNGPKGLVHLELVDLSGKTLQKIPISSLPNKVDLDLQSLSPGTYLLRIPEWPKLPMNKLLKW